MKLQILVPQYKEDDSIVKPLLDSLMIQTGVSFEDFGVIIVNDGTDVRLSDSLLQSYPYKVEYYLAPHRGVSATRNTCLDYATADYVMFCDADDMFYNACGMYLILRDINANQFDTMSSKFIEEVKLNDSLVYINHDNDTTFVHGKVHRRQFLIDNNIRWNPDLTIHEDSFFNIQCWELASKRRYLSDSFYLWKYRPDSVCRIDPQYSLRTYNNLINSVEALAHSFDKRGCRKLACYHIAFMIVKTYYELNQSKWLAPENVEFRTAVEKRIFEFIRDNQTLWNETDGQTVMKLSEDCRAKAIEKGMQLESKTLSQWLHYIIDTYNCQ